MSTDQSANNEVPAQRVTAQKSAEQHADYNTLNRNLAVSGTEPDRNLALELVRVTEAAAMGASRWIGRGDKIAADQAAVDAMRLVLDTVQMDGVVVIGEGEKDEAPMLFNGERVGDGWLTVGAFLAGLLLGLTVISPKILFPLVFLILPALFIVLLAPALLGLGDRIG